MIAIQYAQTEMITDFFKLSANIKFKDNIGRTALDYLIIQFYRNGSKKESVQLLKKYWKLLSPIKIDFEISNKLLQTNSHSMLYFLIVFVRSMQELHWRKAIYMKGTPEEKRLACFSMDDFEKYLNLIPDEILPVYRKKRSYINSVLSSNEFNRSGFSNCKMAFMRVDRGIYTINAEIKWL